MSRSRRTNRLLVCLGFTAAAALGGCGGATDDLPRRAVSGAVTLDGTPLKSAMIQFLPADPGTTTAGGGAIVDGKYALATADGLVPGSYTVQITSAGAPTQPAGMMPGDPVPPAKETIPSRYNSGTTLKASVTRDGPNTFNYELKSK